MIVSFGLNQASIHVLTKINVHNPDRVNEKENSMKKSVIVLSSIVLPAMLFVGCQNMSERDQRISSAALGGAVGGGVGNRVGGGVGAAAGGAGGAAIGSKTQHGSNSNAGHSAVGAGIGAVIGKGIIGGDGGAAIGGALGGAGGAAYEENKNKK